MTPLKILIVDDEVIIGETIKMYLEERGHSITDAVISYEEAMNSLSRNLPDVALIDIRLYGMKSGLELANDIKTQFGRLPIVFITSQFDSRVSNQAVELNPEGYLIKPIHKESLWTTVELAHFKAVSVKDNAKIKLSDGTKTHFFSPDEIQFFSSDHIYVIVHTLNQGDVTVRMSLSDVQNVVDQEIFIRCHRSYLINKSLITKYDGNSFYFNNIIIPVSRSNKMMVKKLMETLS